MRSQVLLRFTNRLPNKGNVVIRADLKRDLRSQGFQFIDGGEDQMWLLSDNREPCDVDYNVIVTVAREADCNVLIEPR